jgi:hypothetical protein
METMQHWRGGISPMSDDQLDAAATIQEEIRTLLDAGWTWDGDRLVHPTHKDIWKEYSSTHCPKIGSGAERLDAKIKEAVRKQRQRE